MSLLSIAAVTVVAALTTVWAVDLSLLCHSLRTWSDLRDRVALLLSIQRYDAPEVVDEEDGETAEEKITYHVEHTLKKEMCAGRDGWEEGYNEEEDGRHDGLSSFLTAAIHFSFPFRGSEKVKDGDRRRRGVWWRGGGKGGNDGDRERRTHSFDNRADIDQACHVGAGGIEEEKEGECLTRCELHPDCLVELYGSERCRGLGGVVDYIGCGSFFVFDDPTQR